MGPSPENHFPYTDREGPTGSAMVAKEAISPRPCILSVNLGFEWYIRLPLIFHINRVVYWKSPTRVPFFFPTRELQVIVAGTPPIPTTASLIDPHT